MDIKEITNESVEYLKEGSKNLIRHIENLKNVFGLNVVVAINRYNTDTENELNTLKNILLENGVEMSLVECWGKGGAGAVDLAEKIKKAATQEDNFKYSYDLNCSIKEKIEAVCKKIYGAEGVDYSDEAEENIKIAEQKGYGDFPVCIAKTQYSFSDDPKNLKCESPFRMTIRDIEIKAGAKFIVVLAGNIITMPGLPRVPAAENIDIDEDGNIVGIF